MEHLRKFKDDPVHNLIPALIVVLHLIVAGYCILNGRDNVRAKGDHIYGYGRIFGLDEVFDHHGNIESDRDGLREHGIIVEPQYMTEEELAALSTSYIKEIVSNKENE